MKEIIIKPKKTFSLKDDYRELLNYKELFFFLSWKDLKVRYKQTFIGVAWAIFQPFITMVVFSIFFGKLAKIPSEGIPYPIFVYTGLLLWQFFSESLSEVSNSLINNKAIITKIYFPRIIIPVSIIITKLIDFFIASIILIGLMIYYQYTPSFLGILILPILLFITFFTTLGLGLLFASINVKYRDVRHALPFFIQLLIFITPVIYPASIAGKYSNLLFLNPMSGVIENARAAILGSAPINWISLGISSIICIILIISGIYAFKKTERYFADIV